MSLHILAVHHEPNLLRLLKVHLERAGYRATGVTQPWEAQSIARQDPPDLLIVRKDVLDWSGPNLLTVLRVQHPEKYLPAILLKPRPSGGEWLSAPHRVPEGYCSTYDLDLPFAPQEVLQTVQHLLTLKLVIRPLEEGDIEPIAAAFAAIGWNKPAVQYERYFAEQQQRTRQVLVALVEGVFAGYLTVVRESDYPAFKAQNIPEIQDFNVLPHLRNKGIGTRLMDAAEAQIAARLSRVGIGVGMTADYGAAQRLYVRRGYIPDGNGLMYDNRPLSYGDSVTVDDALVLHLIKDLGVKV